MIFLSTIIGFLLSGVIMVIMTFTSDENPYVVVNKVLLVILIAIPVGILVRDYIS